MADQHDGAFIFVQRLHQRLARIDVQVVRRFVEDQHMRRIAGDQRQRQPCALAARQLADLRRRLCAGKAEAPQLRAHGAGGRPLHLAGHMLQRGVVAVQLLHLILGEIADAHLARRLHRAVHGRQLRRQQACQRCLPVAVPPQKRDPVIGVDPQVQPLQHRIARAIAHTGQIKRHQRRLQLVGARKIKAQRRVIDHRLHRLHPRQRLGAALRLFRG